MHELKRDETATGGHPLFFLWQIKVESWNEAFGRVTAYIEDDKKLMLVKEQKDNWAYFLYVTTPKNVLMKRKERIWQ